MSCRCGNLLAHPKIYSNVEGYTRYCFRFFRDDDIQKYCIVCICETFDVACFVVENVVFTIALDSMNAWSHGWSCNNIVDENWKIWYSPEI